MAAAPPKVSLGAGLENTRNALGKGLVLSELAAKKMKGDGKLAKGLRAWVDSALFALLKHISGAINIADILTKGQQVAVFVKLMKILHNLSQESAALGIK